MRALLRCVRRRLSDPDPPTKSPLLTAGSANASPGVDFAPPRVTAPGRSAPTPEGIRGARVGGGELRRRERLGCRVFGGTEPQELSEASEGSAGGAQALKVGIL
eukprot:5045060-Alexandrium_andersonii.AAC.1